MVRLKLTIKKLDDVPEELREVYVKDDNGGYRLDLENPPQDVQEQLAELSDYNENLATQLFRSRLVNRVSQALAKAKVFPSRSIMEDIMLRADEVYNALDENGEPVALDDDDIIDSEKNFDWFVKHLSEEAPHLLALPQEKGSKSSPRVQGLEIDANDPKSFGSRIEDIASGKVQVHLKTGKE